MIKIDLITGILGSGKTTLIKEYAKYCLKKGEKIAILENDYGAVNIDMILLQDIASDNCRLEMIMGGGDMDCHQRRFKTRLISLRMEGYDRVIIEPSGIFDMDEFFDSLYEEPLCNWYQIGSVIGIVDASMDNKLSDEMEYVLGSELSCCGKLILSKYKTGNDYQAVIDHINNALEYIKCNRKFLDKDIIAKNWEELNDSDYEELVDASYIVKDYVKLFNRDTINSDVFYFMNVSVKDEDKQNMLSDIMKDPECGNIYRIKGSLQDDNNEWIKINYTKDCYEQGNIKNGQSVLIIIGETLKKDMIDKHINKYNTNKEYVYI